MARHPLEQADDQKMSNPPGDPTAEPGSSDVLHLTPLVCSSEPNFPLHHAYLEIVYAPLIGPGAVLLARNLGRRIAVGEDGVSVSAVELAHEVGLRAGHDGPLGKRSHLFHTIERLEHDHIVRWLDDGRLGVLTSIPTLGALALAKLPPAALAAHRHFSRGRQSGVRLGPEGNDGRDGDEPTT